jgi:transcriptional regulator with XRE-family HTH domain
MEPHIGKNIKKLRELSGKKQEGLASLLNWTQQDISDLEKKKTVDNDTLKLIADALNVTPEIIRNFDPETLLRNVTNNFNDNAVVHLQNQNPTFYDEATQENNINSIEKITELYERLLQELREAVNMEKTRNAQLETEIIELRSKLRS